MILENTNIIICLARCSKCPQVTWWSETVLRILRIRGSSNPVCYHALTIWIKEKGVCWSWNKRILSPSSFNSLKSLLGIHSSVMGGEAILQDKNTNTCDCFISEIIFDYAKVTSLERLLPLKAIVQWPFLMKNMQMVYKIVQMTILLFNSDFDEV